MPGIVVNGEQIEIPGLDIKNWHDDPRLRRSSEDGKPRKEKWVRQVILHTTGGIPGGKDQRPQVLKPGVGPDLQKEFGVSSFWSTSKLQSGAHLIIDTDGSIGCIADLATEQMFHAGIVNDKSIGIEIYQVHSDACIYQASIDSAVKLCDAIARIFGIQRQMHAPYLKGPVDRLEKGGDNCVGFFGHRDVTSNRGAGDPGDFVMEALVSAGYDKFNFQKEEDLEVWKTRQAWLKMDAGVIDGVAGPGTLAACKDAKVVGGLWTLGIPEDDHPDVVVEVQPEEIVEELGVLVESDPTERSGEVVLTAEEKQFVKRIFKLVKDYVEDK